MSGLGSKNDTWIGLRDRGDLVLLPFFNVQIYTNGSLVRNEIAFTIKYKLHKYNYGENHGRKQPKIMYWNRRI